MKPDGPGHRDDAAEAATWVARRDRGLSPDEQDAYVEWMRKARAQGLPIAELEHLWTRLDRVREWRPEHSPRPNPDLLASRPRCGFGRWTLGIIAALAVTGLLLWHAAVPEKPRGARIVPGPERLALVDGSVVEINADARVDVQFSVAERRVVLVTGEAGFAVAKDSVRPFVVSAEPFDVRAIGTAFTVGRSRAGVTVIVTEGRVDLEAAIPSGPGEARAVLVQLRAGQAASGVSVAGGRPVVDIRDLTPAEIETAMAWRGIRLEFEDEPLRDVIEQFNRFNVRQLELGDGATGRIVVAGSFRADNLDGFVRLLETGFNITAEQRERRIVLRRR